MIGVGLLVALVSAGAGLLFANIFLSREIELLPDDDDEHQQSEESMRQEYGDLPSAGVASLPILVPILLICAGSVAMLPSEPVGTDALFTTLTLLGTPLVALVIGTIIAVALLRGKGKLGRFNDAVEHSIVLAAPILMITCAGAAFGAVLGASPLTDFLSDNLAGLGLGIAVPFIIAAALKSAQGSSTVSMVTTSALMLPLLGSLGLDAGLGPVLTVLAIGAGAMVVSHANDSFFWVVSQFSRIPTATAYRTQTPASGIQGVAAFATVWLLSLVLL